MKTADLDEIFSSAGLHIVALQECQGDGITCGSHNTMCKTSADAQGFDGTQIWVLHSLTKLNTESVSINPRLLRITLCGDGRTMHIISARPLSECADPVDKGAFWSQVGLHLSRLSSTTSLISIDANATVGSVVCDSICPVALLQESENGTFLRSLLSSRRLAAVNTFIDGSPTWTDARGHSRRIDYIAKPRFLVPSVKECLVDHDINLSPMVRPDHELLRVLSPFSVEIQWMTR